MLNKVSVFVIGAPKAGTTTLFDIVRKSENIALPIVKEPNYFCDDVKASWDLHGNTDNFVKDWSKLALTSTIGQFHSTRIDERAQYDFLFHHALNDQLRMDFSTNYLRSHHAPKAIHSYNSCSKIVMMVRCPVARAWSHYKMDLRIGYHSHSFLHCLESERLAITQGQDSEFSYIRDSSYADSYARYKAYFKSILVIDFDEFVYDQQTVVDQFCDFCSVDRLILEENISSNKAREARYSFIGPLTKSVFLKSLLKRFIPGSATNVLREIIYMKSENKAVDYARYARFFAGQDIRPKAIEMLDD
jgi:hypothetical protein